MVIAAPRRPARRKPLSNECSRAQMPRAYDPAAHESDIYRMWSDRGLFAPGGDSGRPPFVIVMPPPNVTGALHMGHALTVALEDLMVRWHRMLGDPTLYLPGADHAGIATQVVVERELAREGTTRAQLGRQQFLERVWEWVELYGGRIDDQLKRLGISCDWERRSFTLDAGPSHAVRRTFVDLYERGLIYRGERIINWCPRCSTALSELEVRYAEEEAALYHIRYDLADGGGYLVVATTRPETMLGDTAIAVNPEDDRYADMVGRDAVLPIVGRHIPVISDESVQTDFGTGALKVTPGHDPTDFEIGERHGLPVVGIMNPDGTLNAEAGPFEGLDRDVVREKVVERLRADGVLIEIEPYRHSVGHCDRSGDVVEPLVSSQWFVRTQPLAEPAMEAVRTGAIRIVPERFGRVYFNWMENIRDWCVSRQLWWGHRIPAWHCADCPQVTVSMEDPDSCAKCGSARIEQDDDVLDTWFSSGLWTHSTLGWPGDSDDMERFYPGTVMETGYDILFFWVARMIMLGMFNNDGQVPFSTVYLHGLVLDPQGVKMSKTKGNVSDPLDLVDAYGADALRFALTTGNSPGNDMRLDERRLEWARNFANKVWNSARFVMMNMDAETGPLADWSQAPEPVHRQDRWIMSRLARTAATVGENLRDYQFGEAQRELHDFVRGEYCDWYIEMAKVRIREGDRSPVPVLAYVLERTLRLLHPFMPFVTEELWQRLTARLPDPGQDRSLMTERYPAQADGLVDERAEAEMHAVMDLVRAIRNVRAEFRIQPSLRVPAQVTSDTVVDALEEERTAIATLATVEPLTVGAVESGSGRATMVLAASTVSVPLAGLVDVGAEKERLSAELVSLAASSEKLRGRLDDARFTERAPAEVVERERDRLEGLIERGDRVRGILERLGA